MLDKFKELKQRLEKISYPNNNELDDIKQKCKLYLQEEFPLSFSYPVEVDGIQFKPSYYVTGMSRREYENPWNEGKQKLLNFIDTRIEELEIRNEKKQLKEKQTNEQDVKVVEKIIQVENKERINELVKELERTNAKRTLWERINYFALAGIILTLLSGSFFLGKYFGENRFDKDKIDFFYENRKLLNQNDSLILNAKSLQIENEKLKNMKSKKTLDK